jgi:hypothetical protein
MRFRKQFDAVGAFAAAAACAVDCSGDPGITSQSAARDLDLNEIARRCGLSDEVSPTRLAAVMDGLGLSARSQPFYGDFSLGMTYHEAMTNLARADQAFMDLPAKMRSKFGNSAAALLDTLAAANAGNKEATALLESVGVLELAAKASPFPAAVPAAAAAVAAPAADSAAS